SPWFITAIGRPLGRAINRRASCDGQLWWPSWVEMLASVSESPTATTAPVSLGATTSTPQTKYQSSVRRPTGITSSAAKSPGGEVAGRGDVVGLPRVAPGDPEARRQIAREVHADRQIREGGEFEPRRIAHDHGAGGNRRARLAAEGDAAV